MSQPAVPDLPETFVAELAAADTSAALRERIAGTFQRWAGANGVLFLEQSADSRYGCTFASRAEIESFGARGPLARWLRVNAEVLFLRERPDVVDYLTIDERASLDRVECDACVPLVHGGALVAVLWLSRISDQDSVLRQRSLFEGYAARAAEAWHHLTKAEEQQARRDALGHTQRLGIAGQLAASVAHEVRNPLAAIRSLVQFAKDTPVAAAERESILSDVLEEVDRIDQTVTGMLQLSQPSTARRQVLDVQELVRSVFRFVRVYANRRGLSLTVESDDVPLQVDGDDRELRQVVTNLLLNACQACAAGGTVIAAVKRTAGEAWAEIEIRDTGSGISTDHLARIFEPFFTTKPHGTGLGLPYCRDVAERHGGSIAVQSTPGHGTSVTVRLPALEVDELPISSR